MEKNRSGQTKKRDGDTINLLGRAMCEISLARSLKSTQVTSARDDQMSPQP